jgi:glycosyltransferase involved in cell wall biosynthesis
MPRVCINGRFVTREPTGVERYAGELLKALDELISSRQIDASRYHFELLMPRSNTVHVPMLRNIQLRRVGVLAGHAWEQIELPLHSRGAVLLSPCNTGPLAKADQFVTIHDASVFAQPQGYSRAFRWWYRFLLPRLARRCAQVITDSHFSKTELVAYCKLSSQRVEVVYLGKEHVETTASDIQVVARAVSNTRPFVLAVGSLNPNKNLSALVRAAEILGNTEYEFVITGRTNPRVFSASSLEPSARIRHIGYVTDGELKALYERAACFVFPSMYEGFGLPALEAMACACPVLCSRAASLPEICGDAALYFNPDDPTEIAAKIHAVMTDNILRHGLRKKALERANAFSWRRCALETWSLIERWLRDHPSASMQ